MKNMRFLLPLIGMTCFIILTAAPTGAQMGIFKASIDFADLAQLSRAGLELLKVNEYEVFLARVELGRAGNAEKSAEKDLEKAEQTLKAKELDVKAAKAEETAAKENQDAGRMAKAATVLKTAQENLKATKLLVKWKNREVTARKAGVKKAKLAVQVSEAKRDLARVSRLISENVPAAKKYTIAEYQKKLKEKQTDYDRATTAEERELLAAKKSKVEYDQIAKR